jgi:hypothetical protein
VTKVTANASLLSTLGHAASEAVLAFQQQYQEDNASRLRRR